MKKNVIGVAAVPVVFAVAYVAAAWILGSVTRERIDTWAQNTNKSTAGMIKVVDRRSTGGLFFSREDVTFEIDTSLLDKLNTAKSKAEEVQSESADARPNLSDASLRLAESQDASHAARFTIRNDIAHGPFPEFNNLGVAKISSRLVLDEQTRHAIAKVMGDKDPVLVSSLLGFGGSGLVDVTSPAFERNAGGEVVRWRGFTAHFALERGMRRVTCEGTAPGLAVHAKSSTDVSIGSIGFSCDLSRVFDDLYIGSSSLTLDGLNATLAADKPAFSVGTIAYSGNTTVKGDFIDLNVKLLLKALKAEDFAIDDAEYNVSLKHFYGPIYATLARKLRDLSTSGAFGDPTASVAMMGAIAEYGPQLLEHSPQIVIERIGFSMPEGEAGLKGTLQLKDFSRADLAQANASSVLLAKLHANADVWIDAGLLQKDWDRPHVEETGTSSTADRVRAVQAQVTTLEQQGFITQTGDRLESHLEYKQGALTANGKPVGPAASNE